MVNEHDEARRKQLKELRSRLERMLHDNCISPSDHENLSIGYCYVGSIDRESFGERITLQSFCFERGFAYGTVKLQGGHESAIDGIILSNHISFYARIPDSLIKELQPLVDKALALEVRDIKTFTRPYDS